ncbi:hypothetical protein [Streptomyces sp. NPDC101150]|uniref:hypothetical protein n=1 Tax=Streptomyces sp. NPDC101150 TaxID=3366114 RepID=UPI003809F24F
MRAPTVRRALLRWVGRLFPGTGRRRAGAPSPALPPEPPPRRSFLPAHKSPYAQEATADAPFTDADALGSVRPYVLAERHWALDAAVG